MNQINNILFVNFLRIICFSLVGGKPVPSTLFLGALAYNCLNSLLISRYLTRFSYYDPLWIISPHFLCGISMFFMGLAINLQSDAILRNLRSPLSRGGIHEKMEMTPKTIAKVFDKDMGVDAAGPGGPMPASNISATQTPIGESATAGYKIPYGGMFEYVSCANFFGEIVEWVGFAMASWSLPGETDLSCNNGFVEADVIAFVNQCDLCGFAGLAHAIFTFCNLVSSVFFVSFKKKIRTPQTSRTSNESKFCAN